MQARWRSPDPAAAMIVVTGGAGKAGRAVVRELVDSGEQVLSVDLVRSPELSCEQLVADLTDYGQTVDALRGARAVVHLAAIPAPGLKPDELTFRVNTTSTYNVFAAAPLLGLERVVWASSETVLGLPFEREQPAYAPIDEEHPPLPNFWYALSKLVSEEMARQFHRWTGIPYVGLRFSNVMEPHDYERFPSFWDDPALRKWNLWGYVDARDVAQCCRLALAEGAGADVFIVAAADTCMTRSSSELMAEVYPGVELRGDLGEHETLLSIAKARRLLGYEPRHSWRDHITGRSSPPGLQLVCAGRRLGDEAVRAREGGGHLPGEPRGAVVLDERDDRAAEAAPGHAGRQRTGGVGAVDERVELGSRDLEVVAEAVVPRAEQGPDRRGRPTSGRRSSGRSSGKRSPGTRRPAARGRSPCARDEAAVRARARARPPPQPPARAHGGGRRSRNRRARAARRSRRSRARAPGATARPDARASRCRAGSRAAPRPAPRRPGP